MRYAKTAARRAASRKRGVAPARSGRPRRSGAQSSYVPTSSSPGTGPRRRVGDRPDAVKRNKNFMKFLCGAGYRTSRDRGNRSHEGLRRQARRRRSELHRQAGGGHRLSRAERLRQVDHDAADPRARPAERRRRDRQRQALPRPRCAAARSGSAARSALHPHGPLRVQPSARACADAWDRAQARPGVDRPRRPARCRAQAGRQVLARHGAAARHRDRAARRPAHPPARRAGERARPRGDPLDAHTCSEASRPKVAPSSCPRT